MKKYFIGALLSIIVVILLYTPNSEIIEPFDVIGSYNILNDEYDSYNWYESYEVRVEQIANNIIKSGSDIVGLYEVDDIELLMSYLPQNYKYIYQPRDETGVAIIYNSYAVSLKHGSCRTFLYQDVSNMGYCYGSFINNTTNESVLFIATHIAYIEPTDNYIQMKQTQELVAFINRYIPFFDQIYLVGDFNIDESYNMEYDIIKYLQTYNVNCETSSSATFPISNLTLDYICGDIEEVNIINDITSSDHNLIYTRVN